MKKTLLILFTLSLISCNENIQKSENVSVQDVDNFWTAYDQITSTEDTIKQLEYLNTLFLDKASQGQRMMFGARNYTPKEYLDAINNYPKYWNSIRKNTMEAHNVANDLEDGVHKLKQIYPDLKPAKIYFTTGALRSPGTTMDSFVLIGSELAFADASTITEEFPERLSHLPDYFKSNPKDNLVFLNTHEYIHTQQKSTIGYNVLAQSVLEGVAEYLTEIAMDTSSPNPQIDFGKQNDQRIKEAFTKEMFSPFLFNWIWNNPDNEFGMRDLAYYMGYKISEGYYKQASDKNVAIKEMIELDYNNEVDLIKMVDQSNYFEKPVIEYKEAFEKTRPTVANILGVGQDINQVDPSIKKITIEFSEPMNTTKISTDLGTLGMEHFPKIKKASFSEDGKFLNYDLTLEPNKIYEMVLHWNMRNQAGVSLVPYTLKFKTTN